MGFVYLLHRRWWGRHKDLAGRWRSSSLKVDTKTQATLFIRELEQKIQRQRLGLERANKPQFITFGEVMKRWWAENEPHYGDPVAEVDTQGLGKPTAARVEGES